MILPLEWKQELMSMANIEHHSDLIHQLYLELERRFRFLDYWQLKVEARKILNELVAKQHQKHEFEKFKVQSSQQQNTVTKNEIHQKVEVTQPITAKIVQEIPKVIQSVLQQKQEIKKFLVGVFDVLQPVTYEKRFSSGV
jgi:hypothetical protein